jgi:hypothetical protein
MLAGALNFNSFFFKSWWDGMEGSYRKLWECFGLCGLQDVPDSAGKDSIM